MAAADGDGVTLSAKNKTSLNENDGEVEGEVHLDRIARVDTLAVAASSSTDLRVSRASSSPRGRSRQSEKQPSHARNSDAREAARVSTPIQGDDKMVVDEHVEVGGSSGGCGHDGRDGVDDGAGASPARSSDEMEVLSLVSSGTASAETSDDDDDDDDDEELVDVAEFTTEHVSLLSTAPGL